MNPVIPIKFLLLFLLLSAVLSSCGPSQKQRLNRHSEKFPWEDSVKLTGDEKALTFSIDTFFRNKVKHAGFNGSVLVANRGKIIYRNAFGFARYESRSQLTDTSAFQLASASKPFTATAILQLYEKKKLRLDDPVNRYIKNFPYDSITIRMLLNHRSGLANYIYLFDSLRLPPDSFITNQQVADYFASTVPKLQATPGRRFQYCNSNYAFLALIIEKASRQKYSEYLEKNIFYPSHMFHTYVRDIFEKSIPAYQTRGYHGLDWNPVPPVTYDGVVGDKGIYSTPYDLYLFDQALNHHILLKQETLDEAYAGYSYEKPGIKNYGLGWRIKEFPDGEKLIYHNGWWRGYNSSFERRPDVGICVVVLTNKYNKTTYSLNPLFDLLKFSDGDGSDEDE